MRILVHRSKAKRSKTRRKAVPRPKNEAAYKGCKNAMKKFFKNPGNKAYDNFQTAYGRLSNVNPTGAWSLMKLFKKQMFDRALKKENFK